eukprot:TRINITY_DN1308_c0_g2_i1.p1 TRINITY_DN1308_c0_g2~~TRINITY_DN1308_c0_g2_i1.p1  ORF type:complete len:366 (-),score=83.33 TRINITY_DN1308_c0_g2_i1:38-1135(-)
MVRGKATTQGSDSLATQTAGKEYAAGLNDLIKNSAVRAGDFDSKAFALLDALEANGRSTEACNHLKKALEGVSRERIGNWRGYVYTLLRGFDEDSYNAMKASRSDGRRRRGERTRDTGETANGDDATKKSEKPKEAKRELQPFDPSAKEFVPSKPVQVPLSTAVHAKEEAAYNAAHAYAVAAGQWAQHQSAATAAASSWSAAQAEMQRLRVLDDLKKASITTNASAPRSKTSNTQLKHTATEFVPGQTTWSGAKGGNAKDAAASSKTLSDSATEFVPGRGVHVDSSSSGGNGRDESKANNAKAAQSARTSEAGATSTGSTTGANGHSVAPASKDTAQGDNTLRYVIGAVAVAVLAGAAITMARRR